MERLITQTKYYSSEFNTAIFSDPIRIYFSKEQEARALELYFKMQLRKNQWEKFLRKRGTNNYCYVMLYSDSNQFEARFDNTEDLFAPGNMGQDYILGIKGPISTKEVDRLFAKVDRKIGFQGT